MAGVLPETKAHRVQVAQDLIQELEGLGYSTNQISRFVGAANSWTAKGWKDGAVSPQEKYAERMRELIRRTKHQGYRPSELEIPTWNEEAALQVNGANYLVEVKAAVASAPTPEPTPEPAPQESFDSDAGGTAAAQLVRAFIRIPDAEKRGALAILKAMAEELC